MNAKMNIFSFTDLNIGRCEKISNDFLLTDKSPTEGRGIIDPFTVLPLESHTLIPG